MKLPSSKVWDQTTGMDDISARTYNLFFALTTMFGVAIYGLAIGQFLHTKLDFWSMLGLFGVSLIGCFVAQAESVGVKLIGLTMIAGGLGAITGPYVAHFKMASVIDVAFATVFITLVLGLVGWVYPKSLSHWGGLLFVALIGLILVQVFLPLIYYFLGLPLKGLFTFLDWVGVILFSGFIVFDFNRAQELPKTTDNAISAGINVFLDVANLFIRLLALFGQTSDD